MSELSARLHRSDYKHPRLTLAALEYAALGFRVIPLAGKTPFLERWPERGTSYPQQIVTWFESWPDKNLGILTGDGLIVVDVDPKNGGRRSFRKLIQGRKFPTTATALTGSGGDHYLFRVDPALRIGNINGLMPGLDIKGEGGQFVVEPSVHPKTGREYIWLRTPRQGIAEAPRWLVRMLVGHGRPPAKNDQPTRRLVLNRGGDEGQRFDEIVARFPVSRRGQRNDRMVQAVSSLLGRGHNQVFVTRVVTAWWHHFFVEGTIGTPPCKAPRLIAACIRSILNSKTFGPAVGGTDHRSELAKIELNDSQAEKLDWIITPDGLAIPPHSNRVTSRQRLCRTPKERAFVEALVTYFTYKVIHLRENPLRATNRQFCWVMEDRFGIKLVNEQIERLVEKYITRPNKPATWYELAIQAFKGSPGKPSEYELTGILKLMPPGAPGSLERRPAG